MSPVEALAALPEAERGALLPFVVPWLARSYRLSLRNAAVVAALAACEAPDPTVRACELERRLARYLAGAAWRVERDLDALHDGAPEMGRRLHALAKSNNGEGLGWRRIHGIACAARTDEPLQ